MKKLLLVFIACISLVVAGAATAHFIQGPKTMIISQAMIPYMSKNELIYRADLIVRGVVRNVVSTQWSNPENELGTDVRNEIKTYVKIDIIDVYKGTPYDSSNVIVSINGGTMDNVTYKNNSSPTLTEGEQVIVFLADNNKIPHLNKYPVTNSYSILGFNQGKYSLRNDKFVTSRQDGDNTIDPGNFKSEIDYGLNEYPKIRKPDMTKEEIADNNRKYFGE